MMKLFLFLGSLGTPEIITIALLVLLLFGGKKIPELMRGIGKGVKSFKEGMKGIEDDLKSSLNDAGVQNIKDDIKSIGDDLKSSIESSLDDTTGTAENANSSKSEQ